MRKTLLCLDNANILDLLRKRYRAIRKKIPSDYKIARYLLNDHSASSPVWLPNGKKTPLAKHKNVARGVLDNQGTFHLSSFDKSSEDFAFVSAERDKFMVEISVARLYLPQ